MTEAVKDIKIPIKLRFLTWWNGYDLDDVKARLMTQQGNDVENDPDGNNAAKDAEATETSETTEVPSLTDDPDAALSWDTLRMEMTQLIWGEGYCGPGGKEHIETMSKLLTMNSEMSAIVIGAGLGGPSRVLAEEFGVWIAGFELSKDLAERGMQMSTDAGLGSKAVIHHLDPAEEDPFERRYDRAFSKEALYCFPDKAKILKDTYDTLKDGALFLISDYTLADASALENPDVQKWLAQEAIRPYPVTADVLKTTLEETGFILRVNEDISQEYIGLIEASWSKAGTLSKQLAQKGDEGAKAIKTLMAEAEFWALRAKLLKEGHIRVWRFLANKQPEQMR